MNTLRKKLLRDLVRLRYQGLTIAVVVACGIASLVASTAVGLSMRSARDAFYADAHFADAFVYVPKAPRRLLDRLRSVEGLLSLDARVFADVRLESDRTTDPITVRMLSVAFPIGQHLNQPRIRSGRMVEPGSTDEILLDETLAETWGIEPGKVVTVVLNQRRARVRVVGTAVAPDHTFAAAWKTGMFDPRHVGVAWMAEGPLERALDLEGSFNELSLVWSRNSDAQEGLEAVKRLLEPYGVLSTLPRNDQPSARIVDQKIMGLDRLARTLPVLFLVVAAFLLHVLLARIVGTQREQIATLKALGYRTRELATHYIELAMAIGALGVLLGLGLGSYGAHALLGVYRQYFKFPSETYRLPLETLIGASLLALLATVLGPLGSVRRAVSIPPAEAMRPETPPTYRPSPLDRLYARALPVVRMVLRDLQRSPFRLILSAASIALATAIVVLGHAFADSIEETLHLQFEVSHREHLSVVLDGPRSFEAVREVAHLPYVLSAEGERVVPVRIEAGHRERTTAVLALSSEATLHRVLDRDFRPMVLPPSGLALSRVLADSLALHVGDTVQIEVLEGQRRHLSVPVATLVDDLLGTSAYMDADAWARLVGEPRQANVVMVLLDQAGLDSVTERLQALPGVLRVSRPDLDSDLLRAQVADELVVLSTMLAFFASAIAVGVVYNNARIALEVRARDLATMRILGFRRYELAGVLLGEQAVQVLLGVGPGLLLGRAMGTLLLGSVDRELLRMPFRLRPESYGSSVCVVLLAAWVSALLVRRKSDRLDLVAVLKARD